MISRDNTLRAALGKYFLILGLNMIALMLAMSAIAETRTGGTIEGTVEWTKENSPYIITKDVIIRKGATLRIGPGVSVRFKPNIASREGSNPFDLEILVRGSLIIDGAAQDTVYLTSDADSPRWGDWQGIVLEGTESKLVATAAVITQANEGVKCFQGTVEADGVTVKQMTNFGFNFIYGKGTLNNVFLTRVGNSGGTGIGINAYRGAEIHVTNSFMVGVQNGMSFSGSSSGTVENTVISMCASRGMIIRNSNPEIRNCTITSNDYGLILSAKANPVIKGCNIFQNTTAEVQVSEYKDDPVEIDLSGNWWGEIELGLIEERILDGVDDTKVKAFVMLDPVLTTATTQDQVTDEDPDR